MVFKTVVPSPSALGRCIPLVVSLGHVVFMSSKCWPLNFQNSHSQNANKYPYLIEVFSLQMLWSIINGFLSFPCFTKPQHFLQSQISAFQCIGIEVACVEESVMNLNQKTVSVCQHMMLLLLKAISPYRRMLQKKNQWP